MALHNEQLAQEILSALEAKFPRKVNSETLKASSFEQVPQQEWLLALVNLRITPLGREQLRPPITWQSFYLKWLAYFGREFFEKRRGKVLSAIIGGIAAFGPGTVPKRGRTGRIPRRERCWESELGRSLILFEFLG